jgi:hypothetical protein
LQAGSLEAYAKILRELEIQICAVQESGNEVFRLVEPGSENAILNESDKGAEKKLRTVLFGHKSQELLGWDRLLLQQAGLDLEEFVVGQIYPQKLINVLRGIEIEHCRGAEREIQEIRSTTFGLVESEAGPGFEVVSQDYKR